MSYLLYFSPDSANIVVRMVLEELAADYEERAVPRKRSERDAEFMRLNPRGLLPVLVDRENDCALFETGAILLYLAERHGALVPGPEEPKARAACLKWLFMLSNTLHADLIICFYAERFVMQPSEMAPLRAAVAKRVLGHFAVLEDCLASTEGDWLLSSGLSVCDFYLGACVRWAQIYPVGEAAVTSEEVKRYTRLTALLSRLQRRPSVERAFAREGIVGDAFIDPIVHLPARVADAIGTVMP